MIMTQYIYKFYIQACTRKEQIWNISWLKQHVRITRVCSLRTSLVVVYKQILLMSISTYQETLWAKLKLWTTSKQYCSNICLYVIYQANYTIVWEWIETNSIVFNLKIISHRKFWEIGRRSDIVREISEIDRVVQLW